MDHLSGGRLSLGLSNHDWPGEGRRGASRPRRGGRLEKAISLLEESLTISTKLVMRPLMVRVLSRRNCLRA